jgi:hypothetical protein
MIPLIDLHAGHGLAITVGRQCVELARAAIGAQLQLTNSRALIIHLTSGIVASMDDEARTLTDRTCAADCNGGHFGTFRWHL